jgi:CheY-like chemotaxis protein
MPADHVRRVALRRHELRAAAFRLAADCQRVLDEPAVLSRPAISQGLTNAFLATRRLMAVTADPVGDDLGNREQVLSNAAREAEQAIVNAMNELLPLVGATTDEQIILLDLRAIRDAARGLSNTSETEAPDRSRRREGDTGAIAIHARPARVLVVDDDDGLRGLLERLLRTMGYEVIPAEDGQVALDLALEQLPDLVLTDIDMPRMDGRTLLRELKVHASTKDIPVIVVSSQKDLASVSSIIEAGAEDHIVKPYEAMLLRARVVASLERKRLRDVELDVLRRISELTAAAKAVEDDNYQPGALGAVAARGDALGQLARVFDRAVTGLKSREERLERRLQTLRGELRSTIPGPSNQETSPDSPFSVGQLLANRYEILGQIGRGGMGMVYRARDAHLDGVVAIKVIGPKVLEKDPTLLDRMKSEARLARKISHRNVVRLHDFGEWEGTHYLTMEFVPGQTLSNILDRRGRLTVESTLAVGTQLCHALAVAHDADVIHRDIKPSNVLLEPDGALKLADFGIARSLSRDLHLTESGMIVGTIQYMAPEQLLGKPLDNRADVYAVGVVLYECLTGHPPFAHGDTSQVLGQIMAEKAPPLENLVTDIPSRLARLIHRQLRFNPDERASSASELAERLAEIELHA